MNPDPKKLLYSLEEMRLQQCCTIKNAFSNRHEGNECMYASNKSHTQTRRRTMPWNCFFLAFKRSKRNTHTNTCKHTSSVAMHLSHTATSWGGIFKAERLDVYLWLSVLSALCECVRSLYMSKLPPTPAMTHNSSQCPHSLDWKAPSAAGASSLEGIWRLPGWHTETGIAARKPWAWRKEPAKAMMREREREWELRGRAEREMEGCVCQEMPSVLYMPVPLKPH